MLRILILKISFVALTMMAVIGLGQGVASAVCSAVNTKDAITCGTKDANGTAPIPANSQASLNRTIQNIINVITVIVGVLAVVFVIFAGYRFITSGGDSNKVASAKSALLWAMVGVVVVALAQTIIRFLVQKAP